MLVQGEVRGTQNAHTLTHNIHNIHILTPTHIWYLFGHLSKVVDDVESGCSVSGLHPVNVLWSTVKETAHTSHTHTYTLHTHTH